MNNNELYQLFFKAVKAAIKNLRLKSIVENFVNPEDASKKYSMYVLGHLAVSDHETRQVVLIVPEISAQSTTSPTNVAINIIIANSWMDNAQIFKAGWIERIEVGYFKSKDENKYFDIIAKHHIDSSDVSLLHESPKRERYIAGIETALATSYALGKGWAGRDAFRFILSLYNALEEFAGDILDESGALIDISA